MPETITGFADYFNAMQRARLEGNAEDALNLAKEHALKPVTYDDLLAVVETVGSISQLKIEGVQKGADTKLFTALHYLRGIGVLTEELVKEITDKFKEIDDIMEDMNLDE